MIEEREVGTTPAYTKRRCVKVNALSFAKMVRFMMDGEYSCEQLAELTGLHVVTVYQYTRELHRSGAARIVEWREDAKGRQIIKVYKLEQGRDMPRMRLTSRVRSQRYREKQLAKNV